MCDGQLCVRGEGVVGMTEGSAKGHSELILYKTEDGRTLIECRFEGSPSLLLVFLVKY